VLAVDGGETAGIVGTDGAELPRLAVVGDTLVVGTADGGLTPRLPISEDPNGTPVRVLPVTVVDEVEVGFDDEATLLEPEPHIPDNPDVSSMPEDVDTPDVAEIAVEVDIPDDVDVPDGATPSVVAAVAGVVIPVAIAIPPPS
jgi:hypothetical protein